MFERYDDAARRAIFSARYEASLLKGSFIETQHLLLGILRAAPELASGWLGDGDAVEELRLEFAQLAGAGLAAGVSTSVDMPLSHGCKRALAYAAEEAERARKREITAGHLLLGLLREEGGPAFEALIRRGVSAATCREKMAVAGRETSAVGEPEDALTGMVREALHAALLGERAHAPSATAFDGLGYLSIGLPLEGGSHGVFQILDHLISWQRLCLDYVRGRDVEWRELAEKSPRTAVAPADEGEWLVSVERFKRQLHELCDEALRCDLAAGAGKLTNLQALLATAQRTSYHLGQVTMMRRALGLNS